MAAMDDNPRANNVNDVLRAIGRTRGSVMNHSYNLGNTNLQNEG